MSALPDEIIQTLSELPSSFVETVRYAKTASPSDLDRKFSDLLSFFMASEDAIKQDLFSKLAGMSGFLLVFSQRMAEVAIRTNDGSKLLPAVLALVLEDFHPDFRDTMVTLSLVRHAALRTGIDCAALMRVAATHAKPEAAERFKKIARKKPRAEDIGEMGYQEGTGPDGFAFVQHGGV
jgi:hypothetical protein